MNWRRYFRKCNKREDGLYAAAFAPFAPPSVPNQPPAPLIKVLIFAKRLLFFHKAVIRLQLLGSSVVLRKTPISIRFFFCFFYIFIYYNVILFFIDFEATKQPFRFIKLNIICYQKFFIYIFLFILAQQIIYCFLFILMPQTYTSYLSDQPLRCYSYL